MPKIGERIMVGEGKSAIVSGYDAAGGLEVIHVTDDMVTAEYLERYLPPAMAEELARHAEIAMELGV